MIRALRKPNLFVIGAMKSGTTSLHEYLDTHPQIAMSQEKEPGYFVEELSLSKGEEWYLNLFDQDDRYRYVGESSTHYTKLPIYCGVPERLHRFNPDARLIYIMRNPFDRVISHYWHAVRNIHHGGEPRPLLKAVQDNPEYLAFSDYAMQLEPYIARFGRHALFTLTFEALVDDPQRELDRIYRWLGLPTYPLGDRSAMAHNRKPNEMLGVAGLGLLNRIRYSRGWDRVSPRVPAWFKNWAKQQAYRPVDEQRSQADIPRLRDAIGERQRRQIERLSNLLERDFPEWRAEDSLPSNAHAAARQA
ncbi:MAG: sulfotransferase family protein [Steroidobacteraceae bacterium]